MARRDDLRREGSFSSSAAGSVAKEPDPPPSPAQAAFAGGVEALVTVEDRLGYRNNNYTTHSLRFTLCHRPKNVGRNTLRESMNFFDKKNN